MQQPIDVVRAWGEDARRKFESLMPKEVRPGGEQLELLEGTWAQGHPR